MENLTYEQRLAAARSAFPDLRPDVGHLVQHLVAVSPRGGAAWYRLRIFGMARAAISHLCGHDAAPELRDSRQFTMAVRAYEAGVEL